VIIILHPCVAAEICRSLHACLELSTELDVAGAMCAIGLLPHALQADMPVYL